MEFVGPIVFNYVESEDQEIGEEISFVSRTTGLEICRLPIATSRKSEIMAMYDKCRMFVGPHEYVFDGMNIKRKP